MFRTLVAASALTLGGPALAQSNDQPPTPVRGLDVTVYSATAAGLKWRRASDDRGVRGYEVYQEGELIGEFDALSYIATALAPGSLNNFTVISVDTAGQRSSASIGIAFETPGGQRAVTRPMTPSLRAAVYSPTAAGLAWTRPTDESTSALRVAQYEVRRDGVLVSTTRDASYIDTTLQGGRTYAYELVAINPLGTRSDAARVSVTTPGDGTGNGGGSGSGGDPAVAAPSGLRSVVYSRTAGAIAWDRAATPGFRYEVFRDGTSLGITDGTSYVDDQLSGERQYRYEVIAIDRQGRRSAGSNVLLSTTEEGRNPTPPAELTALDEVSGELITAFAGYRADTKVTDIRQFAEVAVETAIASRELPGTTTTFLDGIATDTVETDVATSNTEYDCALGGRLSLGVAELEIFESSYTRQGRGERFSFDDCRLAVDGGGENVLNGDLTVLDDFDSGRRFSTRRIFHTWGDFTFASEGTTVLTIDGSTKVDDENTERPVSRRTAEFARYVETTDAGVPVEQLVDSSFALRTAREGPYSEYDLTLSGAILSLPTDNIGVVVDTVTDFSRRYRADEGDPSTEPFVGELTFRADDGRSLTLTARDGRTEDLLVDSRYTNAEGEVRERESVPLVELTTAGPSGFPPLPE